MTDRGEYAEAIQTVLDRCRDGKFYGDYDADLYALGRANEEITAFRSCVQRLADAWEIDLSDTEQGDHWLLTGIDPDGNWSTEGYERMTPMESAIVRHFRTSVVGRDAEGGS